MSELPNSNSGPTSNLRDSTGRSFTSSFSGQSGSIPGFHYSGSHNIHGNLNFPNMTGPLAPRNASMTGLPSTGVQQHGGSISSGQFPSNNLQASMPQIPHGHSGISNIGVYPVLGSLGPRMSNSGSIVGGSNIGISTSSGGLSMPGIASRMNLSGNSGTAAINIPGSNRMSSMLPQASPQFMNALGSSYPTPIGSLSQNQMQGGNSYLGSSGMLRDGSSGDMPFDMNDFPQLTGRPNSAGGGQGQYGSLRKHGVSVNAIVQQNQEFSIQNEDFPALPGYKGSSSDFAMAMHQKEHLHENVNMMQPQHHPVASSSGFSLGGSYPTRQTHQQSANSVQNSRLENIGLRPANSPSPSSNSGAYEQLVQQYHQSQTQNALRLQAPSGSQQYKDQNPNSIQGTLAAPDPYSLLGLLDLIRLKESGSTSIALGMDLTALGLNLESKDTLYKTFSSPWSDEPAKGESDYQIPACFSARPPPALQPLHFQKFHPLTLFYIFYSMPKDSAQLYAANELYNKGWFYHKEYRVWLSRVPNVAPIVTRLHERGSYICFDPNIWDTVHKDNFVLHYEAVEKRPVLPSANQNVRREL